MHGKGNKLEGYLKKGEYGTTSFKLGNISTPDWTAKEVEDLVAYFNKEYNKNDTRAKNKLLQTVL